MLAVFFDIDGTLLDTGGAGGTAMRTAFGKLFGIENPASVPYSGRTDRGIGAAMLTTHGLEDSDENWLKLRAAYLEELGRQLPCHEGTVLPGIIELLDELTACRSTLVGLLTGNLRPAAQLKLAHYRLDHYFDLEGVGFGGFGDRHRKRGQVAQEAVRELEEKHEAEIRRQVVIGDTPLDISCAREIGAEVIAVTTGIHSWDELVVAGPDLLLQDLGDPQPINRFLNRS